MSRYQTKPGVILTSICGTHYLVTPKAVSEINETTAVCWKKLEKGSDEEELCEVIKEYFAITDISQLEKDIHELVKALQIREMVVRCAD